MLISMKDKNAAEVDIAPASGKIIKNVRYMSRALGQDVRLKGMSRKITMHSQFPYVQRKSNFGIEINNVNGP